MTEEKRGIFYGPTTGLPERMENPAQCIFDSILSYEDENHPFLLAGAVMDLHMFGQTEKAEALLKLAQAKFPAPAWAAVDQFFEAYTGQVFGQESRSQIYALISRLFADMPINVIVL
ncbi:MAG TPA: hypothetical protein VEA59_07185 [Patescibacteria group bacterium]|nr:hypothetical protein [Patescibacteria group bacterium]